MTLRHLIYTISLFAIVPLNAQFDELEYGDYTWEEMPSYDLSTIDKELQQAMLKERVYNEFFFDANGEFKEMYTNHRVIYVNSDEAIEEHNKQYLAPESADNIKEMARVILPDGSVRQLESSDIQTFESEEDGQSYRYFALEGMEIGSVVEVLTQRLRPPGITGRRVFFQRSVPIYDMEWVLISPDNLEFISKSYNTLPEALKDTTETGQRRLSLQQDSIPPLKADAQSAYTSSRRALIYKLERNLYNGHNDFNDYSIVGQNIYKRFNTELNKKTKKELGRMIERAGVAMSRDLFDKVRDIETYLKENFNLVDAGAPVLSEMEFMMENKVYNESGAAMLMASLLDEMGIEHEYVLTCDRFDMNFDPDFDCYIFLQDYLLYLPELDAYLSPGSPFLRFGVTPPEFAGNHGLFISQVSIAGFETTTSELRPIPPTKREDTIQDLEISVDLSQGLPDASINYKVMQSGYYARYTQTIYQYLDTEQQEEMLMDNLRYFDEQGEFSNISTTNERSHYFGREPMIIEADLNTSSFTETVGPDYLFKVGMLIGRQMEMYQDKVETRELDIESDFSRTYHRIIELTIPAGYTVEGIEQLAMEHRYSDEDGYEMAFVSNYTMEGDKLKIEIEEYYVNQSYPKELFETYRQVINAAADFNKKTLLIKKV